VRIAQVRVALLNISFDCYLLCSNFKSVSVMYYGSVIAVAVLLVHVKLCLGCGTVFSVWRCSLAY